MKITDSVIRFIRDYFLRHQNKVNLILHIIGIPQVLYAIFQLCTGQQRWALFNFFLGYLWQWIGHKYFEKNEVGEIALIKNIIFKIKAKIKVAKIFVILLSIIFIFAGGDVMALTIQSSAFKEGDFIPAKYTCKGQDISPPLSLKSITNNAKSFALVCDDPDAPFGTWVHWVMYDIPPNVVEFKEGIPPKELLTDGSKQGINDFGKIGYGGPCPPPGSAHRYFFKIYALDTCLNLKPGITKAELLKKMEGHIIEEAQTIGKFKR